MTVCDMSLLQNYIMTLLNGHTKGDNPEFKIYGSVIYDEESIYDTSNLKICLDGRTSPNQYAHKMKLQEMTI